MNRLERKTSRAFGLFALATLVLGCESPLPTAERDPGQPEGIAPYLAAGGKVQPPTGPQCPIPVTGPLPQCSVVVNVKHGNEQGKINLKGISKSAGNQGNASGASLTVSALGTSRFNLSAVDLASLRIGDSRTTPATPLAALNKKLQASIVDLNGDGILDLMLHFSIQEMVDRGNLDGTTTSLCLTGSGPGYTINGCGAVTVSGGDGGGAPGGGGFTLTELIPWGVSMTATEAWVANLGWVGWEPDYRYPAWGWKMAELAKLAELAERQAADPDPNGPEGVYWRKTPIPLGSNDGNPPPGTGRLEQCRLTPGAYWQPKTHLVIRTDVTVPAGSNKVTVEFVVDDMARVFWNGEEITVGPQWGVSVIPGCQASYEGVVTVDVPRALLSPDGNNKIAVWAADDGVVMNYFDMRVTALVSK